MKRHFTVDNELVKQALQPLFKSGSKLFFRINPDTQDHEKVNLTETLRDVGLTYENIDLIIADYPFPLLRYESALMKRKAAGKGKPTGAKRKLPDADDEPEDDEESPTQPRVQPYYIVQTESLWWGVFSNDTATVTICGRERKDAEEMLASLLRTKEPYYSFPKPRHPASDFE